MGYVKIPFMSRSEYGAPLQRAISFAAEEMYMSEWQVAATMTFMLEAICNEVTAGNVVRIPGFAIVGPWTWEPRLGGKAYCQPRFQAMRPFRNQVRKMTPAERGTNRTLEAQRRRTHPSCKPNDTSVPFQTFAAWRRQINNQATYEIAPPHPRKPYSTTRERKAVWP